jgi:hypothetical protein
MQQCFSRQFKTCDGAISAETISDWIPNKKICVINSNLHATITFNLLCVEPVDLIPNGPDVAGDDHILT